MKENFTSFSHFSEQGKRENNEDSIFPNNEFEPKTPLLFLVCDGVGGQAKGEIASDLVCTQMDTFFATNKIEVSDKVTIQNALKFVEEKFDSNIVAQPDTKGMASTMTLLHLHSKGATVAHIGDSRVYQFRNGEILFKTKDHSLVQELFETGNITEEQMATHPMRNRITRAIQGASVKPTEPSVTVLTDLKVGDIFLLCSDGVLESFDDDQLKEIFARTNSEDTIAAKLVQQCRDTSNDNYSAYIIKLEEPYINSLEIDEVEQQKLEEESDILVDHTKISSEENQDLKNTEESEELQKSQESEESYDSQNSQLSDEQSILSEQPNLDNTFSMSEKKEQSKIPHKRKISPLVVLLLGFVSFITWFVIYFVIFKKGKF